jgi:hypothetical protein
MKIQRRTFQMTPNPSNIPSSTGPSRLRFSGTGSLGETPRSKAMKDYDERGGFPRMARKSKDKGKAKTKPPKKLSKKAS